jgi:hypothetical protein
MFDNHSTERTRPRVTQYHKQEAVVCTGRDRVDVFASLVYQIVMEKCREAAARTATRCLVVA